jgi:hypothetical protein
MGLYTIRTETYILNNNKPQRTTNQTGDGEFYTILESFIHCSEHRALTYAFNLFFASRDAKNRSVAKNKNTSVHNIRITWIVNKLFLNTSKYGTLHNFNYDVLIDRKTDQYVEVVIQNLPVL